MFADIDVQLHEPSIPLPLFSLCVQKLRESGNLRVHFTLDCPAGWNTSHYTLESNKKYVKKNRGHWDELLVSNVPLEKPISYFEIEFSYYYETSQFWARDGLFVGVTSEPNAKITDQSKPILIENTCALYNNQAGFHGNNNCVKIAEGCEGASTYSDDVIGVVVDRTTDQIRFYLNGKLVAEGIKKPSEFKSSLYALISLYYEGSEVRIVEKHDFRDLK
jgi:hypothetical protein